MNDYFIMPNPQKHFGEIRLPAPVAPTILTTDYKSPPLLIEIEKKMKYSKENPLRVVTLCSGYDSQCMALDRLSKYDENFAYELIGWSEIDKYAIQAHNVLYPQYSDRNLGDMSKINWKEVRDFDFLTYSVPCTDISQSGKQMGLSEGSGTRSSLLWFTRNAILEKRPKYLFLENVKALVSKKFMPDFQRWLDELASYGYANYWKVLNATDFGVPQNRERVFCLSILKTEDEPMPIFHFPRPFPLDKRLKDVVEKNEDGSPRKLEDKYYLSDKALEYFNRVDEDKTHGHNFK